jgi:hypothetical protein
VEILQRMKDAFRNETDQPGDSQAQLQDIVLNTKTGSFTFIWQNKEANPDK